MAQTVPELVTKRDPLLLNQNLRQAEVRGREESGERGREGGRDGEGEVKWEFKK